LEGNTIIYAESDSKLSKQVVHFCFLSGTSSLSPWLYVILHTYRKRVPRSRRVAASTYKISMIVASTFQWHKKFGTLRHQRNKESMSAAAKQKVYLLESMDNSENGYREKRSTRFIIEKCKLTCVGLKRGSGS